ncbi:MAG: LCP family protein [Solirubrobacteraceae bacterium]
MADPEAPPEYKVYRARPRLLGGRGDGESPLAGLRRRGDGGGGGRRAITAGRVVKWLLLALVAWVGLSFLLFCISAQFAQKRVPDGTKTQLDHAGFPVTSAQTILVLGSDQRPKGTKEAGASTSGPSRSDSIMLLRVGGGHAAKLSIPRDTLVPIPGHGTDKINAAFAYGGSELSVQTIKQLLGIRINHVIEVDFTNFPKLIDAMGGIDYTGGCVVGKINGGAKNGGVTVRLKGGTHHVDGKHALALARIRENACNKRENDFSRARRQQKILSAMKSRALSPSGFVRLPWIAWDAPRTVRTDMGAPGLIGLAASVMTSGSPPPRILPVRPSGGGTGLTVDEAGKQRAVRRFLSG